MDRREITGNRPWTSATCPRPISRDQLADQVCEPYMQYGAHLMTFLGVCVCDGGDMIIQIILGIIWGSSDSFFL